MLPTSISRIESDAYFVMLTVLASLLSARSMSISSTVARNNNYTINYDAAGIHGLKRKCSYTIIMLSYGN